jgi:hypothetical protein
MVDITYKYVFHHIDYGVLDSTIYDRDLKLKSGDYIRLNSRVGDEYYRIQSVRKILDNTTSTIIILAYVIHDPDNIDEQIE